MILLIDKSLNFPKVEGLPTFTYTKKVVPVLEIGSFLNKFEAEEFLNYYKTIPSKEWISSILTELENKNYLDKKSITEIVNVSSDFDLFNIIKIFYNEEFIKNEITVILDPLVIIKCRFIRNFQSKIAEIHEDSDFSTDIVQNLYTDLSEKIIRKIMSLIGYKFKFRSLIDEKIILPKKTIEITPKIVN